MSLVEYTAKLLLSQLNLGEKAQTVGAFAVLQDMMTTNRWTKGTTYQGQLRIAFATR